MNNPHKLPHPLHIPFEAWVDYTVTANGMITRGWRWWDKKGPVYGQQMLFGISKDKI